MNQVIHMDQRIVWALIAAAAVILGTIAYFGYQGFRSTLRPLLIFRTGWTTAVSCSLKVPRAVLGIGFVIASGAGLQLLSTAYPVLPEQTFIFASIAWQGVMATAIAALAVHVHLYIIHDVFAERRFGAETHFYRGPVVNEALHARPPSLSLLLRAAAFGLLIWLLSFGLHVGSNALVFFAPRFVHFAAPGPVRVVVFCAAASASFLIMTLATLVRPALSLGSKRPLLFGVGTALRRAPALCVVTVLLLIAPAVIGWLTVFIPHQFFPTSVAARIVGTVIFLIFSIFQTLAVEASTVFFMNRAMNQSAGPDEIEPAAAAAHSAQ